MKSLEINGPKDLCSYFTSLLVISNNLLWQNDLLSWLLDEAKGPQRTVRQLAMRVLIINFGAIHTTSAVSTVFTSTLFLSALALAVSFAHCCIQH
jgi:hypothetical protein